MTPQPPKDLEREAMASAWRKLIGHGNVDHIYGEFGLGFEQGVAFTRAAQSNSDVREALREYHDAAEYHFQLLERIQHGISTRDFDESAERLEAARKAPSLSSGGEEV